MRGKPVELDDFSGGVDLNNDPRELAANVASDHSNVVAASNGRSVKSRPASLSEGSPGTSTLPVGSDVVHIVYNADSYLFATANGRLFRLGATVLHTPASPVDGRGWSIASGYRGSVARWYFMHPLSTAQEWTSPGASTAAWPTAGGLPTGSKAIHQRANRMWIIKGDTLYWSELGADDIFPAANSVTFPGEDLVAIGDCGPYIVLFGTTHIWFIYDFDTGANRIVSSTRGILQDTTPAYASRAFASSDDGVYFHDGVDHLHLSSAEQFTRIGDPIKSLGRPANPSMVFDGRWLYVQHSASRILVYDAKLKSWWIEEMTSGAITRNPRYGMALGPASAGDITVWNPEITGTTHSSAITAYWTKAGMDFSEPKRKRMRALQIIGDSAIDEITVTPDNQTPLVRTPSFDRYAEARINNLGVGREFAVKVAGTDTAQWELNKLVAILGGRQD